MTLARRYLLLAGKSGVPGRTLGGEKKLVEVFGGLAAAFMASLSTCCWLWLAGPSESADDVSNAAEEEDGEGERDF